MQIFAPLARSLAFLTFASALAGCCLECAGLVPGRRHAPVSNVAPLPTPRHGHRAERVGSEVIVFGGYDKRSTKEDRGARETWILDLRTGAWRRGADSILDHAFCASAVIDGALWAIGDDVERYDVEADRWEVVLPAGSAPRSHLGAAAVGPLLHVFGGLPALHGGAFTIDTRTRTIIDLPEPPDYAPGDHLHVVAAIANELHVVGGLDADPHFAPSDTHWIFDGFAWRTGPPLPRPTWAKFAAVGVLERRLYVLEEGGGLVYDADTRTWNTCRAPDVGENGVTAFVMPAVTTVGRRLLVLGGEFPAESSIARLYDPRSDEWTTSSTPRWVH